MNSKPSQRIFRMYAAIYVIGVLLPILMAVSSTALSDVVHVVQTPSGLHLTPSSPLPLVSSGPSSLCLSRGAFFPVTTTNSVSVTFTPTSWLSTGTLAAATNQWSLMTSGGTLRLVVHRSPEGKSGYNHQWMLGVQDRLVNTSHTVTLSTKNGETRIFLDGELRARLVGERLTHDPGSTGTLCVGP